MTQDSKVVEQVTTYSTKDYDSFKVLPGSRQVNKQHVNFLVNKIKAKNLTKEFPIFVNEDMAIIDGRHRKAALEILSFPVYYIVKPHMNSDDMIQLNTGMRNWTWRNFADSFAERGNKNYQQFLQLFEDSGNKRFQVALVYCGQRDKQEQSKDRESMRRVFTSGDFVMQDYKLAQQLLGQLDDITEASKINTRELAAALYQYMRTPSYDHERMIEHIRKFGSTLATCYSVTDYLYELEKIYNSHK